MALKTGDVLTVFPVFQAFWIGFGIVGGLVFYQLSELLTWVEWIAYCAAGVSMLAGCAMLLKHGRSVEYIKQTAVQSEERAVKAVTDHVNNVVGNKEWQVGAIAEGDEGEEEQAVGRFSCEQEAGAGVGVQMEQEMVTFPSGGQEEVSNPVAPANALNLSPAAVHGKKVGF
jgi:hypothetical protein